MMRETKKVLGVAIALNVLLGAGLADVAWRLHKKRYPAASPSLAVANPAAAESTSAPQADVSAAVPGEQGAGPRLVPLQLGPQRLQRIGITTAPLQVKNLSMDIRTAGDVEADEQNISYVQLRFPGWIQKVFVNATYQFVRKGEPLLSVYSPDLVTTEKEYLLARQNQSLLASSTIPGVAAGADSLLRAATARLAQWNVPAREISQLEATRAVRQDLEIDSPASGFVTDRQAFPNLYAQPETRLYTITDLSTVWVYAEIFQNELNAIRPGMPASITVDTFPGRTFRGRVDLIWPQVDMTTRTARVRFVFPNPGLLLKPGMFVNVVIRSPLGKRMAIPASGVLMSGEKSIAFVDRGDGYLEPREIQLGERAGDEYVVLGGLKAGENVVTSANFLIDSESQLQAAIGAFVPPPPGAGAAAAMNTPITTNQPQIQFTSDPSPPRKGANTFRVRVTGSDGTPLTGATITLTFFMPAMPSMGMAAMRETFTLSDRGGGLYEGLGELPSGGNWQVTIVASKGGSTVASRQMSISSSGGM
jgi:RND family efflux transporter MFP subunit